MRERKQRPIGDMDSAIPSALQQRGVEDLSDDLRDIAFRLDAIIERLGQIGIAVAICALCLVAIALGLHG